jgi:hypothetical protein
MSHKLPRPAAREGANRALESEFLGRSSNPQINTVVSEKPDATPQGSTIDSPYNERSNSATARITQLANILTAIAGVIGGRRAFDYTKRSAAFHEAGHAVFFALDGMLPTGARIWPIIEDGCTQWLGHVDGPASSAGRVDSETPPKHDLKYVQSLLAGVVSEILFDADYRWGSSIDEVATARAVTEVAAWKLQRNFRDLWSETKTEIARQLTANEKIVRKIADELMRKRTINSRRLSYLLRAITRVKL